MKIVFTCLGLLSSLFAVCQPAGSLDLTFGNAGKVITSIASGQDRANGVAIQADGKIVVVGFSNSSISGKDFSIVRYKIDGSLDSTFGINGIVTTDLQLGSDDVANSVALQTNGKIVLGGYSDNGSDRNGAIVRYTAEGLIDSTFGNNGIVLTDFENNQQDEIRVLKIHGITGNIVVGGATVITTTKSKPVIARYLPNGVLDSSFAANGIKLLWVTNLDYQYLFYVEDLVVQSNGKISAVGWRDFPSMSWEADYWACKMNSDGTLDETFSTDGVNVYNGSFNGNDKAYAMLLKPDGNILMAGGGYTVSLEYNATLREINSSGTVGGLTATLEFNTSSDDIAYGLLEDNNGKLIIGGKSGTNASSTFGIARLNANASADNAFGTSGKVTTTFGTNLMNECFDIAIQSDNKIIAVGYTGNDIAIARYLSEPIPQLNNFQLTSPANNATNQNFATLNLNWTDAFGATSYEIELDTNQNFSTNQLLTSTTSAKALTNLLELKSYYWRVRAGVSGNFGDWSATWKFTTKVDATLIEDIQLNSVQIFPNPSNNVVFIETASWQIQKTFRIIDAKGSIVKQGNLVAKNTSIPIDFLDNGIYFIEVGSRSSKAFSFIKN